MDKRNHPIEVVPYDPNWPQAFEAEAQLLREVFFDNCHDIYHVGSTSVPGIHAKPTIDIAVGVYQLERVAACNNSMIALGYEAYGERGLPGRRLFEKGDQKRTHNVHVFHKDAKSLLIQIYFRDYLRLNPNVVREYTQLKLKLAKQYPHDREGYVHAKKAFLDPIKAMLWLTHQGDDEHPTKTP